MSQYIRCYLASIRLLETAIFSLLTHSPICNIEIYKENAKEIHELNCKYVATINNLANEGGPVGRRVACHLIEAGTGRCVG